jgi:hypothetical protein
LGLALQPPGQGIIANLDDIAVIEDVRDFGRKPAPVQQGAVHTVQVGQAGEPFNPGERGMLAGDFPLVQDDVALRRAPKRGRRIPGHRKYLSLARGLDFEEITGP